MNKKIIIPLIIGAGLIGAMYIKRYSNQKEEHPVIVSTIPTEIISNGKPLILHVPVYDEKSVPKYSCSKYARLAAKELFSFEYEPKDAWNRRYHDEIITTLNETNSLESLVLKNEIKPGMLIGVYNPNSIYNLRTDEKGNPINYTHIALFLGVSPKNNLPLIAHQYGKKTEVVPATELKKIGLVPKEILCPKN